MRRKLKAKIIEHYGTIGAFCEHNHITKQTASNVLHGRSTPKGIHLTGWLTALHIPENEAAIFFADSVENA